MPKVVLGKNLYSLKEVGVLLEVSYNTVQKYTTTGKIKSQMIGGRKYVTEEHLKEYILGIYKR